MSGDSHYDIICVGFGPSALSLAIALEEASSDARVLFLEKNSTFQWNSGPKIPGVKMHESFLKDDLACMRNPRSEYTFINYLHQHNRLSHFTNLSTHTPLRIEFDDYLRWCASKFSKWVKYDCEVLKVMAHDLSLDGRTGGFKIVMKDLSTGDRDQITAKQVVIACEGLKEFASNTDVDLSWRNVLHSSQYVDSMERTKAMGESCRNIAVVGGGQSAVEIYQDLSTRIPASQITLIVEDSFLRPFDGSPFKPSTPGDPRPLVELSLLENLYSDLYRQRFIQPDDSKRHLRLVTNQEVLGMERSATDTIRLQLKNTQNREQQTSKEEYDLVILATEPSRETRLEMLNPMRPMLEASISEDGCSVDKKHRVQFLPRKLGPDAGLWLCDAPLSSAAKRGGELAQAISSRLKKPAQQARL